MIPNLRRALEGGPLRWLPAVTITALGVWVLWPIPAGHMPLSADHTVHLTRIWMVSEQLAAGHLRGWSPIWFFGTPVGELYPILGDWLVVLLRTVAFMPDWSVAYAWGLTLVFLSQGWVMLRLGPLLGLGAWPGWIAAALVLTDPGQYREGGWIYTIEYGVWPQALATALGWLALGETIRLLDAGERGQIRGRLLGACLAFGAALLAHPMSILVLAVGLAVVVLVHAVRAGSRGAVIMRTCTVAVLGTALAAWWLVPMFEHRAWMASYGWMWQSLDWMTKRALRGEFTQNMPVGVGAFVAIGMIGAAAAGNRAGRVLCGLGLIFWILASRDILWILRLDRLSSGFAHVQYQRFLIAAKPGLFLAAGYALAWLPALAARAWQQNHWRRAATWSIAALTLVIAVGAAQFRSMVRHRVGKPQVSRIPDDPDFERDYRSFLDWARSRWNTREGFHRLAFSAPRNTHWFMDSPVHTHTPTYKIGFTPGDNFVHKPEARDETVLDLLGVRWVVRRAPPRPWTSSFGSIQVHARNLAPPYSPAHIRGSGQVEVLEADDDQTDLTVRVTGSDRSTLLVFGIAGYPRWRLTRNGEVVAWHEVPVTASHPTATPDERRTGQWRAGKAGGNDGSEPTLLAAPAKDGIYHLQFRHWTTKDLLGLFVTFLGFLLLLPRWGGRFQQALDQAASWIDRPGVVRWGGLSLTVAVVWWLTVSHLRGAKEEDLRALGWIDGPARNVRNMKPGLLKTDMGIRSAVLVTGRQNAQAVFPKVALERSLTGWFGVDDDQGQMPRRGRSMVLIDARPVGTTQWQSLYRARVPHRPGRTWLDISTGALAGTPADVRVIVDREGRPPSMAYDLDLGEPVP